MNSGVTPMLVTTVLILGPLGCGAGALSLPDMAEMASGGDTGDADPADSSDDGGSGDGDAEPAGCIVAGQLARAIAVVDSEAKQVHVFEPGGGELTLEAPLPEGVEAPATLNTATGAGFIAIASSYTIYDPPNNDEGAALRLYARDTGALHWELNFDYRLGSTFVDAQGRVVASVGWSATPRPAGIMVVDGQLSELPNFAPVGPLGPSGWMPGWIIDDAHGTIGSGFYNPSSDQLVTVTSGTTPSGWRAEGETIEYIDNLSSVPRFVIAGPQGQSAIELGPFAGLGTAIHGGGEAGDYRLLSAHADGAEAEPKLLRLHVPSGELLEIEIDPPAGLERFDCYFPVTRVDAEGRVLVELRDAGAAGIYAFDAEAATWITLGQSMTDVEDVSVAQIWGTLLEIHASGPNQTYCPGTEWTAPPASALPGTSIQLARLDPPLSVLVDVNGYGGVTVDEQEQCASWMGEGGRRIYDLDDHDELELELAVSGPLLWL